MAAGTAETQVWDPFIRVAHWTLAIAFFIAYFVEDEGLTIHAWAGYVAGALVILRVAWGFVGPRHARFRDFIYRPSAVLGYLRNLVFGHARRYLGHSPAGGAMVIALLVGVVVTGATGLVVYAQDEGAGPLSGIIAQTATTPVAEGQAPVRRERREESTFREVHDIAANLTLFLVIFHVLGVLLASFAHRENLVRAMVTGRKRSE